MKFILTPLMVLLITASAYSQGRASLAVSPIQSAQLTKVMNKSGSINQSSRWFNMVENIKLRGQYKQYNYRFHPDTTLKFFDGTSLFSQEVSSAGQVFDPTFPTWMDTKPYFISKSANYTLDSIYIPYFYLRPQKTKADTLLIQVFTTSSMNYVTEASSPFSRAYCTPAYDAAKMRGKNAVQEIKVVLDNNMETDPSINKEIYRKIDLPVAADEEVAVTLHFIPGNPHNAGDTLCSGFEQGKYIGSVNCFFYNELLDERSDYVDDYYNFELSIYTPFGVKRYANSWLGAYVPGVNYTFPFHTNIGFKITYDDFTGLSTSSDNQRLKMFPNPCEGFVTISGVDREINYELNDQLGRTVKTGTIYYGENRLDLSAIPKGCYYLKVKNEVQPLIVR